MVITTKESANLRKAAHSLPRFPHILHNQAQTSPQSAAASVQLRAIKKERPRIREKRWNEMTATGIHNSNIIIMYNISNSSGAPSKLSHDGDLDTEAAALWFTLTALSHHGVQFWLNMITSHACHASTLWRCKLWTPIGWPIAYRCIVTPERLDTASWTPLDGWLRIKAFQLRLTVWKLCLGLKSVHWEKWQNMILKDAKHGFSVFCLDLLHSSKTFKSVVAAMQKVVEKGLLISSHSSPSKSPSCPRKSKCCDWK